MSTNYVGTGLYGLRPRIWQNGMTVAQGEIVTSPLDWEDYRRIAATGGGTTDPADDLTNYHARSYQRVAAIQGGGAVAQNGNNAAGNWGNGVLKVGVTAGAGARNKVLDLTGRGVMTSWGVFSGANNPTSMRIEMILDGRVILDDMVTWGVTNGFVYRIGTYSSSGSFPGYFAMPSGRIPFRRSFVVWVTPAAQSLLPSNGGSMAYDFRSEA